MIVGATSDDPVFRGKQARAAYGQLLAQKPTPVPIENLGGKGTRNSHWRESIFGNELMSGFVEFAPNPISIVTVASLADLGYEVDLSRAEGFSLPVVTTAREHSVAWRVLNNLHRPYRLSCEAVLEAEWGPYCLIGQRHWASCSHRRQTVDLAS